MFDFGWQTYVLLGAGLLFVVFEVFFPSGGLLGIGAALCLGMGGYFSYQAGGLTTLLWYGGTVAVVAPVVVLVALNILPRTPMGRAIMLSGSTFERREATEQGLEQLVGQRGITATPLRPAGIATLNHRRVDVIASGHHLDKGEAVRVIKVEGNRVIVMRDNEAPQA